MTLILQEQPTIYYCNRKWGRECKDSRGIRLGVEQPGHSKGSSTHVESSMEKNTDNNQPSKKTMPSGKCQYQLRLL
ncbi:hypothetical protein ACS0TY_010332 [Phlomoides rotata]